MKFILFIFIVTCWFMIDIINMVNAYFRVAIFLTFTSSLTSIPVLARTIVYYVRIRLIKFTDAMFSIIFSFDNLFFMSYWSLKCDGITQIELSLLLCLTGKCKTVLKVSQTLFIEATVVVWYWLKKISFL